MSQEAAGPERSAAATAPRTERHPLQSALALAAVVIGLAALVLGAIPTTHFFGAVAGVIGLPSRSTRR
ncbi:hypothetical protein ACFQHO_21495 [Actinomadura yumaensis]|uniref:hypothetical protein n=1 Tax=Actinomadura yumaensis TaxID=111807 RepID=UPI0036124C60